MEDNIKVFTSDITRVEFNQKNDLYDLLNVTPAKPIWSESNENETCYFRPLADKYYVPKKTSRLKVRTVREIRNLFEQDNYNFIMEDMEKQRNMLFTKIKSGSANDEKTRNLAKKILEADHPISRTAWQMIKNINPEKHSNSAQFVMWNGSRIRVMGTKGGRNRFICNYDLGKNITNSNKPFLGYNFKKHRGLLRNSLNIKFKPGPLRKKQNLDDSHQKYHVGPIELVKVPKPALDIQPAYGTPLEPIMTNFLNKLRAEDGVITKTWAEFAVSVLGTFNNKSLVHIDKDNSVTFDLRYKCDQNRILMRRDISSPYTDDEIATSNIYSSQNNSDNFLEIKDIVNKILTSVETSLNQDYMYSIENDQPLTTSESLADIQVHNPKEKGKKRYCELDRLDVTVIQLPGTPKHDPLNPCGKPYCSLGCICDSLECTYTFKQHCGLVDCMFGCKCELTKYKELEQNGCAELIPGLIKLDNEINSHLAKEEQKFHQTVIVSGEKSIVLKSTKRNLKSSRKYADFYSNMRLKSEQGQKKILTVLDRKLNCSNIEPWCMVHNLYKCFCKGRFTETSRMITTVPSINAVITIDELNSSVSDDVKIKNADIRNSLRPRARLSTLNTEKTEIHAAVERNVIKDSNLNDVVSTCARTTGYFGRKYEDSYYKLTNFKILEMEKNDTKLHKKMMRLQNNAELNPEPKTFTSTIFSENSEDSSNGDKINNRKVDPLKKGLNKKMQKSPNSVENILKSSGDVRVVTSNSCEDSTVENMSPKQQVPFEISSDIYKPVYGSIMKQEFLVRWMALGYKNFKQRLLQQKTSLEIPIKGKIILHSWEFVLKRYRERKNIFMVSKNKPFRIFMAREVNNYFFENCINIDTIRFADLHKYPFCVKNLLTNATSEEHFCILGGWEFCWEIVGSVKQCGDRLRGTSLSSTENFSEDSVYPDEENWNVKYDDNTENITSNQNVESSCEIKTSESEINSLERSKWFLMILENDFSEIHCHRKGFYVKRERIIHIINLARITRKTIVINKQTNTEITNIPFGIYAIPNTTEYCVFVGPYEMDEPLGLEILKKSLIIKQNNTRGVWITTNKVDNVKVLDDPLSFIQQKTNQDDHCKMITLETRDSSSLINNINTQHSTSLKILKKVQNNDPTINGKIVKPIKIRRINGLYHLSPKKSVLKKLSSNSVLKSNEEDKNPNSINVPNSLVVNIADHSDIQIVHSNENNVELIASNEPVVDNVEPIASNESVVDNVEPIASNEPVVDNVSQLKIISICSENIIETERQNNEETRPSMFILKPEEINKRLSDFKSTDQTTSDDSDKNEMSTDIEKFLSSSGTGSAPDNDVFLISDDDEEEEGNKFELSYFKPILIKKIKKGKILNSQAKMKINMMTENKLLESSTSNTLKTHKLTTVISKCKPLLFEDPSPNVLNKKTSDMIEGLEATSRLLEDESVLLLNETERRQTEIIETLSVPEELKSGLTITLQGLKSLNDQN